MTSQDFIAQCRRRLDKTLFRSQQGNMEKILEQDILSAKKIPWSLRHFIVDHGGVEKLREMIWGEHFNREFLRQVSKGVPEPKAVEKANRLCNRKVLELAFEEGYLEKREDRRGSRKHHEIRDTETEKQENNKELSEDKCGAIKSEDSQQKQTEDNKTTRRSSESRTRRSLSRAREFGRNMTVDISISSTFGHDSRGSTRQAQIMSIVAAVSGLLPQADRGAMVLQNSDVSLQFGLKPLSHPRFDAEFRGKQMVLKKTTSSPPMGFAYRHITEHDENVSSSQVFPSLQFSDRHGHLPTRKQQNVLTESTSKLKESTDDSQEEKEENAVTEIESTTKLEEKTDNSQAQKEKNALTKVENMTKLNESIDKIQEEKITTSSSAITLNIFARENKEKPDETIAAVGVEMIDNDNKSDTQESVVKEEIILLTRGKSAIEEAALHNDGVSIDIDDNNDKQNDTASVNETEAEVSDNDIIEIRGSPTTPADESNDNKDEINAQTSNNITDDEEIIPDAGNEEKRKKKKKKRLGARLRGLLSIFACGKKGCKNNTQGEDG